MKKILILFLISLRLSAQIPVPSPDQLRWHDMEYYAFIHFGPNSFTNKEWGDGKEKEEIFNPSNLDCRQWARIAKAAGMKGIIITAKHHDGFCLFPSKFSKHTVRESKWKNGKGDVLKELSAACKEYGLKMGIYISPWDRNHPTYGTPSYNDTFANMLSEVLTKYGSLFEVWFDGANGEGPNGKKQIYDFPRFNALVKKYQPHALIFSDCGPDIRWVGNEKGFAGETCWATMKKSELFPAYDNPARLNIGDADGTDWLPAECDVSIRPGWFYHKEEDDKVKTPAQLLDIWDKSVGRGANLILNIPVDSRGIIHENDEKSLMGFKKLRDEFYGKSVFSTTKFTKIDSKTYDIKLQSAQNINTIVISEDIKFGQRVKSYSILYRDNTVMKDIFSGTTIGHKHIINFPKIRTDEIQLIINDSIDNPIIKKIEFYETPTL